MDKIYGIIPGSSAPLIFVLVLGLFLMLMVGFFAFIGYSSRNAGFELSDDGLRITKALYGRFIPKEEIVGEGVRVLNLNVDTEYKPRIRTNGIGLPGYAAGWFKLKNDEKALLFVTDNSSVVYIPTTQGYSVLLSVRQAEEMAGLIGQWR